MDPVVVGLIGIGLLLLLFMLRMPVSFAMAFVGWVGYCYLSSPTAGCKILVRDLFTVFNSYPLTVIPTFVLMGAYAFASGISERLYKAAYDSFGQLRGGLAITTVMACAGFAAVCGSTSATVATIGKIAYPEMKRYRYDDTLATGCIATAATLGILIPPSTIFIVYGILTEQSIGKLFIAGVLPGLVLAGLFTLTVLFLCYIKPLWGPAGPATTWRTKIKALSGVFEAIALFGVTMGGLFAGWFTPTQAGSIGAVGALAMGLLRRGLTWRGFLEATIDGVRTSCMILFLIAGATVFGHFMAITRIPFILVDWVRGLELAPEVVLGIICLFYLVGGCFIDAMALVVLTVPIIYPVVIDLGFDPIWFGVIIVLVSQVGVVSPPVGVNVYVLKGIASEVALETIFKGALFFVGGIILTIVLLMVFPDLATFLPKYVRW
ncbi:MAG: C4-dicarboxylate ABC transporter permease [Deltaproteobacteria bacterium]|nr:MAG: C4-dicarboxylate ABC transporter permease [Deltaproteobacteria bacterium]